MAQDSATKSVGKPPARYEDDFYTWLLEQVALLRAGRLTEIDALNVAEELSDVAKSEYRSLESAFAVLAQHLLKWDHQPERRSRSWFLTMREQRRRVGKILRDNPGLKARLAEAITDGYADGRDRALSESQLADDAFPETCPYELADLMERTFDMEAP